MSLKKIIKRSLIKQAVKPGLIGRTIRRRLIKRVLKPIPLIGTSAVVVLALGTLRRKGPVKGSADVALDLIPVIGVTKAVVEVFTGDLIPDK